MILNESYVVGIGVLLIPVIPVIKYFSNPVVQDQMPQNAVSASNIFFWNCPVD